MSVVEELRAQFEALNQPVNSQILRKCEELCTSYLIDVEDFMDLWLAYTASNLNGAPPSLDALDKMERKELKKQKRPVSSNTPQSIRSQVVETTPIKTPVRQNLQQQMQEESFTTSLVEDTTQTFASSDDFVRRNDACSVQLKFGLVDSDSFKKRCTSNLIIKIQNEEIADSKYMYEKFSIKQDALNSISRFVIHDILKYNKLEITHEKLKQYSGEMTVCGRIYSESFGKLELSSIQLEGLLQIFRGQIIKLSLNNADKLSLFSGQSVVVVGNNQRDWFVVREIYTGAPLPMSEKPVNLEENLQIMVAVGPFTLSENLLYEPLKELLNYAAEFRPNLLILMGPFMHETHLPLEEMCESYEQFFENLVDGIMRRLDGTGIEVILVPSHKDIHNHVIFPTLPYKLKRSFPNLYLAPNPFILDVNGLIIGGSTADILFHLSKVECSRGAHQSRIDRLVPHIFNQRSFYPLHPPDADVMVDYHLLEQYGMFETAPHILFLPSKFKHFVKVVEGSVVINPESLIKGNGAGTFARVEIRASDAELPICDGVSCQIYRV